MIYNSLTLVIFATFTFTLASILTGPDDLTKWHRNSPRQLNVSMPDFHTYYVASITDSTNVCDGLRNNTDHYTWYIGDGDVGWPAYSSWTAFDIMFEANRQKMLDSCSTIDPDVTPNTNDEVNAIWYSIQTVAKASGIDHRFILAVLLQETGGCVRAPPTTFRDHTNHTYPKVGIMGTPYGVITCNPGLDTSNSTILTPCPDATIYRMINESVFSNPFPPTSAPSSIPASTYSLVSAMNLNSQPYSAPPKGPDVEGMRSYRAAWTYLYGDLYSNNGGTLAGPGVGGLGTGNDNGGNWWSGTCYASDIANRVTGWVGAVNPCEQSDIGAAK